MRAMLSMAENDSLKDSTFHPAAVECHSGYKACERPLAFTCQWLDMDLSGVIAETIEGMKPVAEEIGLTGNPD